MPPSSTGSREALGFLLGAVGVAIFAATLPMTRLAVTGLSPWFVTFGRAAIAGCLALALMTALGRPFPAREHWRALALGSAALVIGFPGLIGLAMQLVPASHGGVVLGILPLATAGAAGLFAGERPSMRFWLFAVLGAALVVVFSVRQAGGHGLSAGDGLLFLAAACTGLGYAVSGRLARTMPGWEVISWMLVIALPLTLVAALILRPVEPLALSSSVWGAFAYLAVMSQYVGFFAWNAGLAMGGVARVGQVQLLQTFATLAISAVLLGEVIGLETLLFAAAVLAIVVLGRSAKVRPA